MEEQVASESPNPFGVEPPSFWRRLRSGGSATPKPVARAVGVITGLLVLAAGAWHNEAVHLAAIALLLVPGLLLERWYGARRRREREELLPR